MKTRLLSFLPALVLIAVAQIYSVQTAGLSPWKGGGFGMFSSTQLGMTRYVRVFVSAQDRSEELAIPESLIDSADRAATLPTNSQLQSLPLKVAARERRNNRMVSELRIEVWGSEYEKVNLASISKKIRDYVYKVD